MESLSLDRSDTFELYVRLEWMKRNTQILSEEMWGVELELGGVHSAHGQRLRAGTARITGTLPTHPAVQVVVELAPHASGGYQLTGYHAVSI
jgi:hypothetical protein